MSTLMPQSTTPRGTRGNLGDVQDRFVCDTHGGAGPLVWMIFGRDHLLYLGFRAFRGTSPGVSLGNRQCYTESGSVTRNGSVHYRVIHVTLERDARELPG